MSSVEKATRSQTKLYLLGDSVTELSGSKLPSLRMALGFFLHHHLDLKETVRQSSDVTITEIANFWKKARIPMRAHQNCQTKLEQTFEEWRLLKKNKARTSPTQLARESAFVSRLEDLFDVTHADALTNTSVLQEDKDLLLAQREKGRRGSLAGVDVKLAVKEKTASKREEEMLARRQRMEQMKQLAASTAELISSGSESENSSAEDSEKMETGDNTSEGAAGGITFQTQKRKRGRKTVVTEELAAALDRTKVSDRKAVHHKCTLYTQDGCEKDSCHVQPESEQQTVLVCGMKVEETEGFPEILQIKIEDVNSFGLEEEQSDQPNDLFVKVEVKTEHGIDVHLDRPKPNDAEASFLENHPHEGSPTMCTQDGCEKDSCHVQLGSEQQTVLVCGMKVEETEGFPEILQIKIEDVNSFGLEEEQSYQPNGVSIESTKETAHTFMNSVDVGAQDPRTETNKRTFYKHNKRNNELFARNNFHQAHKGEKDELPYKCISCGKSFNHSSNLKRHMIIHNDERSHKCTSCGKSFNQSSNLKSHMIIHNDERSHKCTSCGKSFNQASNLKQHMRIHNGERPYKCISCGKSFNRSSHLKQHMMIHNGERPYKCISCGKSFNLSYTLKRHMMIHNGERSHKCTSCGKSFNRSSNLKQHMIIHNGERSHKCTSCGKSFNQSSNLKQHMRIHNGERSHKCTSCGKSFNQSSNLKQHMRIHNGERSHKCTSCGKSFNRSSHLKQHMMIHNGERPYKCISCGKSFNLSSTLKIHVRIHNAELPYKCISCGKYFNHSSNLKRHMMIHNGERPHKCISCGKSFNLSSHLKRHMIIHNGERPYKCISCGKSFNRSSHIARHMIIHNGEPPYKCTSCGKSFNHSSNLKKHMIIHNGERPT
uniref:zinc finger protein 813-like n=1 Tax=Myxine glutinosa TaxID=7769 RepID=UPI00358F33D6